MSDCIFCDISEGVTGADVVFESEDTMFFRDISPKAPVHVVGIPKRHIASIGHMTEEDIPIIGRLVFEVATVAKKLGIAESGYRIVSNAGQDSGQEVQHMHVHVLGGAALGSLVCNE